MKTLKIGRSSTNDIVISDVTVSSQHAIITILDTKEVRIKDLNSTNGTFVNGKRIDAETPITASDVIKVGSSALDWVKHLNERKKLNPPVFAADASAIKCRKTIGRENCDIVINRSNVSSKHAQLIEKENGDIVIADSGSTNGTYVNGQKVSIQVLRPGDRVLIANKYPLDWDSVFGKRPTPKPKILQTAFIAAAVVTIVIVGIFLFSKGEKVLTAEKIYAKYEKSIVLIYGEYHYNVTCGNYNLGKFVIANGKLKENVSSSYTGTGFFVSQNGKIITNKHVAEPWAYSEQEMGLIKKQMQEYLKSLARQSRAAQVEFLPLVNEVQVTGEQDYIGIIPNGHYASTKDDIIPCHVVRASDKNEIDVAVIQTKSPNLPAGTTFVDLNTAITNDAEIKDGRWICTMGFPAGFIVGQTSQGLKATNSEGKITQQREYYDFGHDLKIVGGASGSPVFNGFGHLIGVINAGFTVTQSNNMAIKAKYAVELAK
ncbi:MAG: FHA domain-containing protein [Prevotellaceae bacterium]|jgi:pSer/pThr/pTyr-binding forkhead associated (FHA) protein/V8-like Glu-specific endopeptidase|nr:FHA domain-containing protein [Prevotellaceae bacterium]